ncbi:MAG: LapA family protein [Pseudomonadales bacterium]|jgi:uncharacterized integral membrane protein|nr:LapA family protein [Pseudomonadales bacterium]
MKYITQLLLFLVFLLVVLAGYLFTQRNPEPVALWVGLQLEARPLSVWILGAFISGGVIGLALGLGIWRGLKTRYTLRQQRQRIEQLEQQSKQLRERLHQLEDKPLGGGGA